MREKLPPLFSIVAGVENESAFVQCLEQNDSYCGLIAISDCPERHRVRFRDDRTVEFFGECVDAAKPLDWISWDQLIPRHRRIDFVDPAQNPTRQIADFGDSGVGELASRVHAPHANLAVENGLLSLVQPRNFRRNPVEGNEACARDMADLPFVRFPYIDDLELLSILETLCQLGRLDFPDGAFGEFAGPCCPAELVVVDSLRYFSRSARRALWIAPNLDCAEGHRHHINREQLPDQSIAQAEQLLDRFGGLDGSN